MPNSKDKLAAETIENSIIFRRMTKDEIADAMKALHATEKKYRKGTTILHAGDITGSMGLVLSGSVTVESNDIWGNRTILTIISVGDFFAETYALLGETLRVDAVANEACLVLFLELANLRKYADNGKGWAMKFTTNLLSISARKNMTLSGRSFDTSSKTIRGRVMSYLNAVSIQKHSRTFDIPFDRQQLADYLNVERSALSKELGKMQQDNLIRFRKAHFELM